MLIADWLSLAGECAARLNGWLSKTRYDSDGGHKQDSDSGRYKNAVHDGLSLRGHTIVHPIGPPLHDPAVKTAYNEWVIPYFSGGNAVSPSGLRAK